MSDWNTKIIEEFRANGGAVGGQFAGAPLLLLHTVGARSGQRRVNPVMYQKVDGGYAVFASKAGAPVNPDWYHNLLAQPQVTAEIGTQTVELVARVADGDERECIWAAQKAAYPGFADYERKTTRQIPVIVLEPARLWRASAVRAERLRAVPGRGQIRQVRLVPAGAGLGTWHQDSVGGRWSAYTLRAWDAAGEHGDRGTDPDHRCKP